MSSHTNDELNKTPEDEVLIPPYTGPERIRLPNKDRPFKLFDELRDLPPDQFTLFRLSDYSLQAHAPLIYTFVGADEESTTNIVIELGDVVEGLREQYEKHESSNVQAFFREIESYYTRIRQDDIGLITAVKWRLNNGTVRTIIWRGLYGQYSEPDLVEEVDTNGDRRLFFIDENNSGPIRIRYYEYPDGEKELTVIRSLRSSLLSLQYQYGTNGGEDLELQSIGSGRFQISEWSPSQRNLVHTSESDEFQHYPVPNIDEYMRNLLRNWRGLRLSLDLPELRFNPLDSYKNSGSSYIRANPEKGLPTRMIYAFLLESSDSESTDNTLKALIFDDKNGYPLEITINTDEINQTSDAATAKESKWTTYKGSVSINNGFEVYSIPLNCKFSDDNGWYLKNLPTLVAEIFREAYITDPSIIPTPQTGKDSD